jgi:A/G-specific adenine glycosylase
MEFGALVCTARRPRCTDCPLAGDCSWFRRGRPADPTPRRSQPEFAGSDRQARGEIMRLLREGDQPISSAAIANAWPDADQARRALEGLLSDGLVSRMSRGRYALPLT